LKGVLFQATRQLQVLIQKKQAQVTMDNWRPSFIAISKNSCERLAPFDLLRWISHHHGFGSFIHYIQGPLTEESNADAKEILNQLIGLTQASSAGIYVDTIVSPSFKTAVAQIVQIPGIAGMENNSILFEFKKDEPGELKDIIEGCDFAAVAGFNICILRSSERHFGYHKKIHIWLTPGDLRNANLMILLAYILVGHPDWKHSEVTLFATFTPEDMASKKKQLYQLVRQGQLLISQKNVQTIRLDKGEAFEEYVSEHSETADLVFTGFSLEKMRKDQGEFLQGFESIKDILFVRAGQDILIKQYEEEPEETEPKKEKINEKPAEEDK